MLLDVTDHALADWSVKGAQEVLLMSGEDAQQLPINGQSVFCLQKTALSHTPAKQCAAVPESSPCILCSIHGCQQAVALVQSGQS